MTGLGTARWLPPFGLSHYRHQLARLALAGTAIGLIGLASWLLLGAPALPWQQRGPVWQRVTDGDGKVLWVAAPGNQLQGDGGPAPKIGARPPDFSLLATDGTPVRLSDLRGHPVLLNFWATWCQPCRKEFPELVRVAQTQADQGLIVVGIDVGEGRGSVVAFAQEFGATFPLLLDAASTVAHRYRVLGLPMSLFLDRDGVLRAQQLGPLTQEALNKKLADVGITVAAEQ